LANLPLQHQTRFGPRNIRGCLRSNTTLMWNCLGNVAECITAWLLRGLSRRRRPLVTALTTFYRFIADCHLRKSTLFISPHHALDIILFPLPQTIHWRPGSSPAGGSSGAPPQFDVLPPVAAYIPYCIFKKWSPLWLLAHLAAKSWQWACWRLRDCERLPLIWNGCVL